jgi:hypothetical protein
MRGERTCDCSIFNGEFPYPTDRRCIWAPRACPYSKGFEDQAENDAMTLYQLLPPAVVSREPADTDLMLGENVIKIRKVFKQVGMSREQGAAVTALGNGLVAVGHALLPEGRRMITTLCIGDLHTIELRDMAATIREVCHLHGERARHCRAAWRKVMNSCGCHPVTVRGALPADHEAAADFAVGLDHMTGWRCCGCKRLNGEKHSKCCGCEHPRGSTSYHPFVLAELLDERLDARAAAHAAARGSA